MKPRQPMKRTFWKRKPRAKIKPVSDKRQELNRAAAGLRRRLANEAGCCMVCGHSSRNPNPKLPIQMSKLCAHEISNGQHREASLDKPFCILITCYFCNSYEMTNKAKWPESRQLALLKVKAEARYDLEAYLRLTNPRAMLRITQDEVDKWIPSLSEDNEQCQRDYD